jgi:hypothetical protein
VRKAGSQKRERYCWRTYFKVLGVLFLREFSQLFCPQRRHVGHTKFSTFGFANSIGRFRETLTAQLRQKMDGDELGRTPCVVPYLAWGTIGNHLPTERIYGRAASEKA